jgi:hypothetical protein
MTNSEQSRALRAAIMSLQSGLLVTLEFLEILANQSTDPSAFRSQIQAIRESIQLLDQLPPPEEAAAEEPDEASQP